MPKSRVQPLYSMTSQGRGVNLGPRLVHKHIVTLVDLTEKIVYADAHDNSAPLADYSSINSNITSATNTTLYSTSIGLLINFDYLDYKSPFKNLISASYYTIPFVINLLTFNTDIH